MHRLSVLPARGAWLALAITVAFAPAGRAADFFVIPPVVIAAPGAVVQIPIEMSQSLDTLGVEAIQYTLPIDPAFVSNVTLLAQGVVWAWGAPFTNVTSTSVFVAAAGVAPLTSTSTRLHTLQFTVSPTAPVNQAMPLSFSVLRFNEGAPNGRQHLGALIIRTGTVGVGAGTRTDLPRLDAAPNPMRGSTRIAYQLPAAAAGRVALEVFGLDGRRLRVLRDESAAAGEREVFWDGRDAAGRRMAPGVYLARLDYRSGSLVRRLVILE